MFGALQLSGVVHVVSFGPRQQTAGAEHCEAPQGI